MKKILLLFVSIFIILPAFGHEQSGVPVLDATISKNRISGDVVVYNLSNGKLHTADCEWAEKCTKNCIYIKKKHLKKTFFVPCMVCGGGVLEPMSAEELEEVKKNEKVE